MIEAMKTACTQVPTMPGVDNRMIPTVRTFSGVGNTDTAPSLEIEISTNRPIATVSCEGIRKAFRIGKGILAGAFSTASLSIGIACFDFERKSAKHTRNRAQLKTGESKHLASFS